MKLSEAIRLGAAMKPQCRADWFDRHGGSCALGAAIDATGSVFTTFCGQVNHVLWPAHIDKFLREKRNCPVCDTNTYTSFVIAEHLNDMHLWTRERIADWVEVIELEQEINRTTTTEKENECQIA